MHPSHSSHLYSQESIANPLSKSEEESIHCVRREIKRIKAIAAVFARDKSMPILNKAVTNLKQNFRQLSDRRDYEVNKILLQKYQKKLDLDLKSFKEFLNTKEKNSKKNPEKIHFILKSAINNISLCKKIFTQNSLLKKKNSGVKKEVHRLVKLIHKKYQKSKRCKKEKTFHSWRANIKNLFYLLEAKLVQKKHPEKLQANLNRLGKQLGKLHDLFCFKKYVSELKSRKLNKALKQDKKIKIKKCLALGKKTLTLLPSQDR